MTIVNSWSRLLGRLGAPQGKSSQGRRPRLELSPEPEAIYAIGDVHGCLDLLLQMRDLIDADARQFSSAAIILLGDVVDRGPQSAQCIDFLLEAASNPDCTLHVLQGNHESLMLDFLDKPDRRSRWLEFGGVETLGSYGISPKQIFRSRMVEVAALVESHVPAEHVAFLRAMPVMIESEHFAFVHAGIRAEKPLSEQSDDDLIWYRDDFNDEFESAAKTIVHGHTPVERPFEGRHRIAIDTGAYQTGRLTAVRLVTGLLPEFISTVPSATTGL